MTGNWTSAMWIVALLVLAACGVDGPPEPPAQPATGLTVGGDVRLGVTGSLR